MARALGSDLRDQLPVALGAHRLAAAGAAALVARATPLLRHTRRPCRLLQRLRLQLRLRPEAVETKKVASSRLVVAE